MEKLNSIIKSLKDNKTWSKNVINTKMNFLGVSSSELRKLAKEISKNDYLGYLEKENFEFYENTIIFAKVLSNIENFELFKKYLYKLINVADNWATCDCIEFKFSKELNGGYFNLAKELICDERVFARRIGVRILFRLIKFDNYFDDILNLITAIFNEKEYYVNMAIAWLLCEAYIINQDKVYKFLQDKNNVCDFVFAKTISKCCDSYRISNEDKKALKDLKKKLENNKINV